jgi:hypothetical protein
MRVLVMALALCLAGCGGRAHPGEARPYRPSEVAVIVESQYSGLVTIYLEANGRSQRLGEAHFSETRSYVVPWRSLSEDGVVSLRGEVIGSDEAVYTGRLTLTPGSVVRWTLTPRLSMSYYAIY